MGHKFAFSCRDSGNMAYHCGLADGVRENRSRFLCASGMDPASLVLPQQVHGDAVIKVGEQDKGKGAFSFETGIPATDALVTRESLLPIGILTADCLPVLIFSPDVPAAAAVHAGWKSTKARIAAKTVARLAADFGCDPRSMTCYFGPAIRRCCYKVGGEFRQIFPRSVLGDGDDLRLDLAGENRAQLVGAGVLPQNINDPGICTCCDSGYFSYRRDGDLAGRMLSVIMLE